MVTKLSIILHQHEKLQKYSVILIENATIRTYTQYTNRN